MRKNLRQSILRSLGRYIAIVMIIALGSCLFIGLLTTRKDLVHTGDVYTTRSMMYDFRMISTYGWEDEQVDKVKTLEDVAHAEGVFYQDLIASRKGEDAVYRFYNLPEGVNQVLLRGGRMPENSAECLADGYFWDDSLLGTQVVLSQANDEDSLENMNHTTYTIVGYVASPLYMDPNRGTTTVGTGSLKGFFYIPMDGFCADYYTQIDLTLKDKYPIYSDGYNDYLDAMTDGLEQQAEVLGQERFDAIRLEAEEEYQDGYQEYLDGLQEYNDGVIEFEQELTDARQELEDAQVTIDRTNYKLNRASEQLEEAKGILWQQEQQLNAKESELKQLEATTRAALPQLEGLVSQYEAEKAAERDKLPASPETISAEIQALTIERAQYPEDSAEYAALSAQIGQKSNSLVPYMTAAGKLSAVTAKRDEARRALNSDIPAGFQTIAAARVQIEEARDEIEEQGRAVYAGRKELDKAREDLAQGWIDYEEGKLEGEQELADAWQELEDGRIELADARKEIDDMEPVKVYLLDRNTNIGYSTLDSSANILAGVSRILPVFFLLVASLVCITTMTRMIDEERTQIGTLKALGYSNTAIISKYLYYAGSASVLGSILGGIAGSTVIPEVLWVAYSSMLYLQPEIELTVEWPLCIGVGAVCVGLMLLVTWYSCRKTLVEEPAELIRPKAPDPGKKLLLEKLPFWNRISFLNKVSIRNIFRYRQRLAMMLVGIGGCTALLVTGFGLRNSLVGVVDYQYDNITLQHLEVYLDGHQEEAAREELRAGVAGRTEDILFLHQSNVTLDTGTAVLELTMLCGGEDLTRFVKLYKDGEQIPLPGKDEVVLSVGAGQNLGLHQGDVIQLRNADMQTMTLTVSGFFENHISNYAIISPETHLEQLGTPAEVQMAYVRAAEGEDHYLLAAAITEMDNVLSVSVCADFATLITGIMNALDMLVWVIVICAALLAAIVLYNLTNINIAERIREIATIKVLGFNAGETAAYVFKENIALTVAGSIMGLFLGKLLLIFVLQQIKVNLIWFRCIIQPESYVLSLVLTMVCTALVNFVFYFKLDKINMAEALKSVE